MSRVLFIPHAPRGKYKLRTLQFALAAAERVDTLYLDYTMPDMSSRFGAMRVAQRVLHRRRTQSLSLQEEAGPGGLRFVSGPFLVSGGHDRVWSVNRSLVNSIVKTFGVTHVVNASALYFPADGLDVRYAFDLVDDHADMCSGPNRPAIESFLTGQIGAAEVLVTASNQLADVARQRWRRESLVVPNGAEDLLLSVPDADAVDKIRERLGAAPGKLIGYIGNHGSWSGVKFLVEAFAGLATRDPELRLAIIGPGVEVDELRRAGVPPGVTLTGGISPDEIGNYYHAIDVGVLPFAVMPFTDNAMPLKVIEYGFAKKPVLATPLKELARIGLPHVRFAPREREAWEQGLAELLRTRWAPEWEPRLLDYRWKSLTARLLEGIGL